MAGDTVQLSAVSSTLLPPDIIGPIFSKTLESSAVMNLARQVPLSVDAETAIPIPLDVPVADWVVEGGRKAVSSGGVNVKTMSGKKVAVMVPVSEEVVMSNAAGLWTQLQQDLPVSIARAFDHAAIHGKTLYGATGPFTDYLSETAHSVTIPTASAATGGLYTDIVNGEQLVVDSNYDFSGFAADPRLVPTLKLAVDANGRPLFNSGDITVNGFSGSLDGYPVAYNRGVSGILRRQADAGEHTIQLPALASGATSATPVAPAVFTQADVGSSLSLPTSTTPIAVTISSVSTAGVASFGAIGGATVAGVATVTRPLDTTTQKLRAIGGDWSQAAWGQGMGITVRLSREASFVDNDGVLHSAFQENLVLLLCEAYYGFVMGDSNAFVKYVSAS